MKPEFMFFWTAVALYGVSAFSYIFGMMAKQDKLFKIGLFSALAGFIPHTVAIGLRWAATSISPFIATSESLSLGVFMAVLIFLALEFSPRKVMPMGVLVMPISFVLMGWAGTLMEEVASTIAPALQSGWIWAHIVGASAGFGAVLAAAGLGLMYLLKEKNSGGMYAKLPDLKAMDELSYRFVAGGFIMYGLMMVSGCFWANQVKGNYWNWDPVEVWSLVSWLTYGIYLHLRVTFGWRGKRLAWYALLALVAMIVSYWGIPFTVETFHSGFRIEH
ncbi:cytochrome c biogenesis protein CcsA [Geobacter sp. DSM 9736]|uniref:cytochrome c biogenesis protein CcsA n=1 Tax=Geobacter sp. DSM 9736 TaxID=1277350 RepID=UPI000B4FD855|nr:cytochrome c biogenesis protein CcsA [Geobacter sp. DSM 9736]SNB47903.1 cytochrome c-type biogenesis protein CcsB [Geobacter sp. DSM 9736]